MAVQKFRVDIDLLQNKIKNALMDPVASDPGSPVEGQIWYNTAGDAVKYYDGTTTHVIVSAASTNTLTNKTIDAASNTLSNLNTTHLASGVLDTDLSDVSSNDDTIPSAKAVKTYVSSLLGAADALQYKGALDCSADPNYPAANAGDTYKISVAGKIGGASGIAVEVGDMAICTADSTASGNHATVGQYWNIIQSNIDGAVIGPASSTDNAIARFDSTTGKLLQNSSVTVDDNGTLNLPASQDYKINGTSVLNSTTLGSGVTSSSLTSVGTLSSGNATAIVDAASDTAAGKVELATTAETTAKTDSARAVVPSALASFERSYSATFSNSTGQTVTAATHGIATVTSVTVEEDDGSNYVPVGVQVQVAKATYDVTWAVNGTGFNGRITIQGR